LGSPHLPLPSPTFNSELRGRQGGSSSLRRLLSLFTAGLDSNAREQTPLLARIRKTDSATCCPELSCGFCSANPCRLLLCNRHRRTSRARATQLTTSSPAPIRYMSQKIPCLSSVMPQHLEWPSSAALRVLLIRSLARCFPHSPLQQTGLVACGTAAAVACLRF
jgi:hypothetical protein